MISRLAVAVFSAAIFLLTSAIPASAEEAKPPKKGAKAPQSKKVVKKENAAKPKPKAEVVKKQAKAKPAPKTEKKESAEKAPQAGPSVSAKAPKKEDAGDAESAIKESEQKPAEKKSAKIQAEENYILFESKPAGAEVLVDGFYMGNTPVQLSIVDGRHSVKLVRPGFSKWEKRVVTYAGFRIFAALEETKK